MKRQQTTIRRRVMGVTMATTVAALFLSWMAFLSYEVILSRREVIANLSLLAQVVGNAGAAALLSSDKDAAGETLSTLAAEKHIVAAALYRENEDPFVVYERDPGAHKSLHNKNRQVGTHFEKGHFVVVRKVNLKGSTVGAICIHSDMGELRDRLAPFIGISLAILFLTMIIAAAISFRLQRSVSDPIRRLAAVAARVSREKDYSVRSFEISSLEEINMLVKAFDHMLEEIQGAMAALENACKEVEQKVKERTTELRDEIGRRQATENDLRVEMNKAESYLNLVPVLVLYMDSSGLARVVNRQGCRISGYKEDEIVGKDWFDLVLPEADRDRVREIFRDAMAGQKDFTERYEAEIVTKGGERRLLEWHNRLVTDDAGNRLGVLTAGADITEIKKAGEELMKAQKLESIGVFAGGIAHDFNNFLMCIQGNIGMAKLTLGEESTISEFLGDAEAAAARAAMLTKQLITFAKGGEPVTKTMLISELVKSITDFAITGSNVTVDYSVADDLWFVDVDPGQLEQVVTNLIINAKQAMPEGGKIHVGMHNVTEDEAERRGITPRCYLDLSVKDEGAGIQPENINKIFDPYFSTKKKGIGLGLATSYSIVKKHGGHIEVASARGEGAVFHVYLPASSRKPDDEAEQAGDVQLKKCYSVLIMDDDQMVGKTLMRLISAVKCDSSLSPDGVHAIDAYKKAKAAGKPFDVVILDVIVPGGMGGRQTAQHLLEFDPDVRMIVSSGYSDDQVLTDYRQFGFRARIAKPYSASELAVTLHNVLEH